MNPESAKEEESPGQLPNGTESQSTGLDKPRRARGAPPGNRNGLKHGLYVYKAMLDGDGLDQRTSLFKALREKEDELITALGGDPSPQERVIIADTVKHLLFAASLDHYLLKLKSLVRKGRVHGVVSERTRIGAHIRENLKTLGLKRVAKTLTLRQLLEEENGQEQQPQ